MIMITYKGMVYAESPEDYVVYPKPPISMGGKKWWRSHLLSGDTSDSQSPFVYHVTNQAPTKEDVKKGFYYVKPTPYILYIPGKDEERNDAFLRAIKRLGGKSLGKIVTDPLPTLHSGSGIIYKVNKPIPRFNESTRVVFNEEMKDIAKREEDERRNREKKSREDEIKHYHEISSLPKGAPVRVTREGLEGYFTATVDGFLEGFDLPHIVLVRMKLPEKHKSMVYRVPFRLVAKR